MPTPHTPFKDKARASTARKDGGNAGEQFCIVITNDGYNTLTAEVLDFVPIYHPGDEVAMYTRRGLDTVLACVERHVVEACGE